MAPYILQTGDLFLGSSRIARSSIGGGAANAAPVASNVTIYHSYEIPQTGTTVLQLSFDGNFTDDAGRHTVSVVGPIIDTGTTDAFGGTDGVAQFDGSNDYINLEASSDFQFTGDFTLDCWVNFDTIAKATQHIFGFDNTDFKVQRSGPPSNYWYMATNGGATTDTANQPTAGQWHHLAVTREGNQVRFFVDGVLTITRTDGGTLGLTQKGAIGAKEYSSAANLIDGYMDEFRIVEGEAMWTSNFTPPTRAYPTP